MTEQAVEIDGNSLSVADANSVATDRAMVSLSRAASDRMATTRRIVDDVVRDGKVVYGVNTGFGKLSDVAIPAEHLAELQVNLLRSHCAGVGDLLAEPEVRAMMLLRANVLAKGHSGVRPDIVELILEMLNGGIFPPVPEQGSVGASGDLAPLSHLALSLIGEGDLIRAGERKPAGEMLRGAGLAALRLEPKEGIALINGTQAHTGIAVLLVQRARHVWAAAHVAGAMSLEALLGTPVAFDERIHKARGQSGQMHSAALLRRLLANSELRESHRVGDPRIQDPYSLRCMPQVHGPALDALDWIEAIIAAELNAATDNPLVFEDGAMLSGGNFHGMPGAISLDLLAIAMTHLATMSERRIDRLVNPDLNQGLPPFLSPDAGLNSGFMMAQVTAAALASECKLLSHPASVDSIPTDGNKEDVVPMAMGAAWKARRVVANLERILAIELMCAAQGIDFRAPLKAASAVMTAHAAIRKSVEPLKRDRVLSGDIEALAGMVSNGCFSAIADEAR